MAAKGNRGGSQRPGKYTLQVGLFLGTSCCLSYAFVLHSGLFSSSHACSLCTLSHLSKMGNRFSKHKEMNERLPTLPIPSSPASPKKQKGNCSLNNPEPSLAPASIPTPSTSASAIVASASTTLVYRPDPPLPTVSTPIDAMGIYELSTT